MSNGLRFSGLTPFLQQKIKQQCCSVAVKPYVFFTICVFFFLSLHFRFPFFSIHWIEVIEERSTITTITSPLWGTSISPYCMPASIISLWEELSMSRCSFNSVGRGPVFDPRVQTLPNQWSTNCCGAVSPQHNSAFLEAEAAYTNQI